jgi:hypothetical protein
MVKVYVAPEKYNCEHLLGQFLDESHYDILIDEDYDGYLPADCDITTKSLCEQDCSTCDIGQDESRVAFKFRKNFFTKEEQEGAYLGLREAATESQNRGLAAGPRGEMLSTEHRGGREWVTDYEEEVLSWFLRPRNTLVADETLQDIKNKYGNNPPSDETRGRVWLRSKVCERYPDYFGWFDKWAFELAKKSEEEQIEEARLIHDEWISVTNYAKSVFSGVAGWYDRYPRIPYGRATSYTEKQFDTFKKAFPFLQSLDRGYKQLIPQRWSNQKAAADKLDSRFLVPETVFTTVTVNKSFRTAAHRDAGDLNDGLSNLLVVGSGDYTGGYLVFPELRVAVNVRPGDLLLVNNHEIIHGNTPIVLDHDNAERISLVCYFREKMLELKSFEYESARREFVETRRANKDHPMQRHLWNGVSPGMWATEEWLDFLTSKGLVDEDGVVGQTIDNSLEGFFA